MESLEAIPKLFSLRVHQATQNENDIMVSQQVGSDFKTGDIVEIYKEDNDRTSSHLMLKVTLSDEASKGKGSETVSIVDTICNNTHFSFKTFNQVFLKKIAPEPVDLVVLTCKDAYLSRSDMWKMKKLLEDTCVYIDKRVVYVDLKMQLSVSEIWSKGEALACGYISHSTRVCFRSASSVLHIFLQMSAEMWEYDSYGDLYFEKAVSGFLTDLFDKWKNAGCGHDVTIVMFSRTFYEAMCIEDFPMSMKNAVQRDSDGRFYEDFYRVVIKNERYDDWKQTIMKMKQLFINYQKKVLRVEQRQQDPSIPKAYNSSAAQGNYLEVINMSLNVFEKYFLDRNFDRLGKTAVVITPGPGVFEVDKDLMNITKHRTIDSGSSADLICMGEQPLHNVPLFKVKGRNGHEVMKSPNNWINLSFYTSQTQMRVTSTAQFVPRIKVASLKTEEELLEEAANRIHVFPDINEEESDGEIDYDAYDRAVFDLRLRGNRGLAAVKKSRTRSRMSSEETDRMADSFIPSDMKKGTSVTSRDVRYTAFSQEEEESSFTTGSAERLDSNTSSMAVSKPDPFDPFNPNSMNKTKSANRRRWVHAFPIDKNGVEILPHHIYVDDPRLPISSHRLLISGHPKLKIPRKVPSDNRIMKHSSSANLDAVIRPESSSMDVEGMSSPRSYKIGSACCEMQLGAESSSTGLDSDGGVFSLMTKTGVDWRSLTTPASLPITTDYYPDEQHFSKLYQDQVYILDPQLESPMKDTEFFKELVSIRLALGFQLIKTRESELSKEPSDRGTGKMSTIQRASKKKMAANTEMYRLSIGKIFHQLNFSLQDSSITVRVQQPQKVTKDKEVHYRYQFMSPDCLDYNISDTKFVSEQPENYKWNLLDNYIINRGFKDLENREMYPSSKENMKYWCSRYCLLPSNNNSCVKKIRESLSSHSQPLCDIFSEVEPADYARYNEFFIRVLLDLINTIKRASPQRSSSKRSSRHGDDPTLLISSSLVADDQLLDVTKLDLKKVVEKMRDPSSGLSFLDSKATGLPVDTFISYEAVLWVRKHCRQIKDNTEALALFQKLLDEKHMEQVNHTNHNQEQFLCGFYLYYLTGSQQGVLPVEQDASAEIVFEKEWVEVLLAVLPEDCTPSTPTTPTGSSAVQRQPPSKIQRQKSSAYTLNSIQPSVSDCYGYKSADTDAHISRLPSNVSKKVEWISLKYYSFYHPCCGFDFQLNWIMATGSLLSEMINSWKRRVGHLGFHLMPIPVDPFALPMEKNSDPLRAPLSVPLDPAAISNLSDGELIPFMRYLITKFGFIPIVHEYKGTADPSDTQFIHSTGGFFILISNEKSSGNESTSQPGFLWSWNFMMTRQWWSPSSGDEMFEDAMLADFRRLAADHDGRLTRHANEWKLRAKSST